MLTQREQLIDCIVDETFMDCLDGKMLNMIVDEYGSQR